MVLVPPSYGITVRYSTRAVKRSRVVFQIMNLVEEWLLISQ